MEKRNFEFRFFDKRGKEIKIPTATALFGVDFEFARAYMFGIIAGLHVKYASPNGKMYENGKVIFSLLKD